MYEIHHLVTISAAPEEVFEAISTEQGFKQWWTADVEITGLEGGSAQFGFFERATVYRMRVDTLFPHSEVRWTCETGKEWKGTYIRFELRPVDQGTLLRFRHSDWQTETDFLRQCNTTWGELMYRLKAVAEGAEPGPLFTLSGLDY